jgi:hypothetical protein
MKSNVNAELKAYTLCLHKRSPINPYGNVVILSLYWGFTSSPKHKQLKLQFQQILDLMWNNVFSITTHRKRIVTFIIPTANVYVAMETGTICDITPCSLMKVNRHFGGTWMQQDCLLLAPCWLLAWLTLRPCRRSSCVTQQRRLTTTGPHGVIPQET